MLTTSSQFGPRARSLRTKHATATAAVHRLLGASGGLTMQQCQQTRDFRFGSWFSHLDSEIQEKIRRHEQTWKQRCLDRGRHSEWDKHPLADDARHAVKRMMASYWLSHDARPCGRHDDAQSSRQHTPDNKDGVRPGQNIEDVERGAMEHLIFGKDEHGTAHEPKLRRKRGDKKNKHAFTPHTSYGITEEQAAYFIDPITNRRVAKHPAPRGPEGGVDIPVKTFKDYRTRFNTSYAAATDETRLGELPKASQVETEPNTEYPGGAPRSSGKPRHGNSRHNRHAEAQDTEFKYDDLHEYKAMLDDGQVSSKPLEQPYTNLDKYKPVTNKEPVQFEDLKPPYEGLDRYDATMVDEIVARFEGEKVPDSHLQREDQAFDPGRPTEQDSEPKDEDLDKIRPSFEVDTTAEKTEGLMPQEELDSCRTIKDKEAPEKPLGPQIASTKLGTSVEYQPSVEDLEPGDFPPSTIEKLREKYGTAELRKYTAARHVEPEQNSLSSTEDRVAKGQAEIHEPEQLTKNKSAYHTEPHGNPLPSAGERVVEDLTKRYDPEELAKYGPVYWNKPDGQLLTTAEELSKNCEDLDRYGPAKCKEREDDLSGQIDTAKDGLEEMDAIMDYKNPFRIAPGELDRADESSAEVLRKIRKIQQSDQDSMGHLDPTRRSSLILQMKTHQAASDATDHEASLAIKFARARAAEAESESQLTGNYVRDFPEEFERSWTETLSTAPTETAQSNEEFVFESQNMDGGLEGAFGRPSPVKIQPALDRHLDDQSHMVKTTQEIGNEHSDSKSAQDLDEMHINESGETPTSPAHNKYHQDIHESAIKDIEPTKPNAFHNESANEPTLYKILAYDPTMQKIEIAETSSFVPDTASALTPADALLRLSHPTRFFPHFRPLQAEGYEIISGTGDVLVFRKVRPETNKGKAAEQAPVPEQSAPTADEAGPVETRINPIDMTGMPRFSPASANFASPTGYVNYENIPETAASKLPPPPPPPPPRIKYNIDVHREEPVFSGPKARADGKGRKKKGLGKRLIVGGVWVAGISYALGVISEYFTTGGIDGKGPQGL